MTTRQLHTMGIYYMEAIFLYFFFGGHFEPCVPQGGPPSSSSFAVCVCRECPSTTYFLFSFFRQQTNHLIGYNAQHKGKRKETKKTVYKIYPKAMI